MSAKVSSAARLRDDDDSAGAGAATTHLAARTSLAPVERRAVPSTRPAPAGSAALLLDASAPHYAAAFGRALQRVYVEHRDVAQDADVSPATAKNWWHGRNTPNGAQFHRLIMRTRDLPTLVERELARAIESSPSFDRNLARVQAAIRDEIEHGGSNGQE